MQIFTVSEFARFCEKTKPEFYVYDTDNQDWNDTQSTMRITAKYKIMMIFLCPNTICFKNDTSCISFRRVKHVLFDKDAGTACNVFSIVCGNERSDDDDISYTIMAS